MVEAPADGVGASVKLLEPLVGLAGTHLGKEDYGTRQSSGLV